MGQLTLWIIHSVFQNEAIWAKPAETHLKGNAELMKILGIDFAMLKKIDCGDDKKWHATKMAKKEHEHKSCWAIFIWIMGAETKATCTGETALKWAKRIMRVFNHIGHQICQFKPNFELGGDLTAEEGKQKMHIGDMLRDDDTFEIIRNSMEEVTKMKALHSPDTMEAHFGNEERIKRVVAKHEEEEKMKANKKSIGKEEFDKVVLELLESTDDDETNTKNSGGSG
jgi:hypothetical protein